MTAEDLGLKIVDDRNWLLRRTCHGDPTRCFWVYDRPFPLCSRCTTFYPSIVVGSIAGFTLSYLVEMPSWTVLLAFVLLELPLVIDGLTQYKGWRSSNNVLRALTGMMAGIGIGWGIAHMAATIFL